MKFGTSCFAVIILFGPSCLAALAQTGQQQAAQAKPGLHDILLKTVHDTASYLGFGVKCRNGGHKTEESICVCPRYYTGKECEIKTCINNGKLERVTIPTVHQVCKCPNPEFITGDNCQTVRCANHGVLETFKNNATWRCDCKGSRFYGGEFCEKFVVSSGWLLLAACFGIFVIVALVCSSNWFSRTRPHRRYPANRYPPSGGQHPSSTAHSRSGGHRDASSGRRAPSQNPRAAHRSSSSDDLISSERPPVFRPLAPNYANGFTQHVVRLDTIPTFNPNMIGGVEPMNPGEPPIPVGPPPSYDQAMSSVQANPPSYTPTPAAKNNS